MAEPADLLQGTLQNGPADDSAVPAKHVQIAAFAPSPRAMVNTAKKVKPGLFLRDLQA
jgi:hypothetical protein